MRYRITCFVLALLVPVPFASAFDEGRVSKLHALNECVVCDLGLADLQNLDPSYANLTGAVLRNANLAAAVLSGANLIDTDIRDVVLKKIWNTGTIYCNTKTNWDIENRDCP